MASPTARKDAEYQYYSRVAQSLGIASNSPLSHFKRMWWAHVVGSANALETATDLQFKWLGTFAGVTGKTLSDRWREVVVSIGQPPAATMEENEAIFYTFAP